MRHCGMLLMSLPLKSLLPPDSMELVCDEDIPHAFIEVFREHGFRIHDIRDEHLRGAPDEAVFRFAAERHAVILTGDLAYAAPKRFNLAHISGLIVNRLPQTLSLQERVGQLRRLLGAVEVDAFRGYITILEAGRMRRRKTE